MSDTKASAGPWRVLANRSAASMFGARAGWCKSDRTLSGFEEFPDQATAAARAAELNARRTPNCYYVAELDSDA